MTWLSRVVKPVPVRREMTWKRARSDGSPVKLKKEGEQLCDNPVNDDDKGEEHKRQVDIHDFTSLRL